LPFVGRVFADAADAGGRVTNATCIAVQIVRQSDDQIGFKVHKRRWGVERFFAWIGPNRRFSRDGSGRLPPSRRSSTPLPGSFCHTA